MDEWSSHGQLKCPKQEPCPMADETEYRIEFGPYTEMPTTFARLRNRLKQTDSNAEVLFGHHERPSAKHMITVYDEHINRRARPCNQELPPLRKWNLFRKTWQPERNDFPLTGNPTNWGLANWKDSQHYAGIRDLLEAYKGVQSDYNNSYINHFKKQQNLRRKIPCYLSKD
ncbi:hypothetical protein HELRODRAFT_167340 [Helobdella robusta]|uniref:Uncharacterized protein n=1 Tax=Helobdella robusta TaxID=6412 RepID=T1EZA0_HELRO|nr:hypothetical protein HELRODRAFT_167340 [Helobdella robusta]ESO10837.1 hypothetical protein HELRODRAFT_167340 [Helobdella robusta]